MNGMCTLGRPTSPAGSSVPSILKTVGNRYPKNPRTSRLRPNPATIWLAPNRVIDQEKTRPSPAPATIAASKPRYGLPVWALTTTAVKAPANIIGSSPMLTMPPCLLISPPMAASRMDVLAGAAAVRMPRIASDMAQPPPDEGEPAQLDDRKDHYGSLKDIDQVERDVAEELDHGPTAAERAEEDRR